MQSFSVSPIIVRLLSGMLLIGVIGPSLGLAQQPMLVPQPRELQARQGNFKITPGLEIVLLPIVADDDRFAAECLAEELKAVTQQDFAIVSAAPAATEPTIVLGRLEQPSMKKLLDARGLNGSGIGEQGYLLDVMPGRVLVAGKDATGLFYGVQSLKQLLAGDGQSAEILGVQIRDWPALLYRGTQVDMSRGPVLKLPYLKRIVRTAAEFKMNELYLYLEDTFRLEGQPLVGLLSDTLTRNDWKELVAYAGRYHVDLIPATEACGHLHKVLRFEQYGALGERLHGHTLAPGDPQALAFLDNMYGQMAGVFPAAFYHIGCDETSELGLGRSAERVRQEGYGEVYVDHLIKAGEIARRYGKQVMFWGDMAVAHPEMISRLPKDFIVASWEYDVHPSYDRWLKPFAGTGLRVIVCPWAGNSSLIMTDYAAAAANIEGFLTDGKNAGAMGAEITVWNDDGEALYGLNWWSIVYGAACAWELGTTPVDSFNQKYDWVFYRNTDHRFAEAIQHLSQTNEMLRTSGIREHYHPPENHGGANDVLFWRNPFTLEGQGEVKCVLPVAPQVRLVAENAYTVFADGTSRARRNADTLATLEFAALKLDALAMRYEFIQEISQLYSNALAHESDKAMQDVVENEIEEICSFNGRLQDLRDYTTQLRGLYEHLWLSENLPTGLPNVLQLYDRQSQMWQDKIAQFRQLRSDFEQSKPLPPTESLGLMSVPATK